MRVATTLLCCSVISAATLSTDENGLFSYFDEDVDDDITITDLYDGQLTRAQVYDKMNEIDDNGKHAENQRAFLFFDSDDNGFISATELRQMFATKGCQLTAKEADEMTRKADIDYDGQIDYNEFMLL